MRSFVLGVVVSTTMVGTAAAEKFAVFYENDPKLDDPCKFLFVNIAGTVLPGGSNNYLQVPIGPYDSLAQAQLARDLMVIDAPPGGGNMSYTTRCRKAWAVDKDPTGTLYMRDQTVLASRSGMQQVANGLCGRDAAAMVRAANTNGIEPAYAFDVCVAPSATGGIVRYTKAGWVQADGKPVKLAKLAATKKVPAGWVKLGVSDCTGLDVAKSRGTEVPVADLCTKDKKDSVAVCWDTVRFKNGPERWCTYKGVSIGNCTGGTAPGVIYECRGGE